MGKPVLLVTGAAGLAGTAILQNLASWRDRYQIRATYHVTRPPMVDGVEYVQGNLANEVDCRRIVDGCELAIIAAAGTSGAGVFASEPWRNVTENLSICAQLLKTLALSGAERAVVLGSATMYQPHIGLIKEEQLDLNNDPPGAYMGVGWVSRYVEKLSLFWQRCSGLKVVTIRASNFFGPHAQFDPRTSNFVPALIRKAVDRLDPFPVWGSPAVVRDILYVDDLARAVCMLVRRDDLSGEAFNIGSGKATTVEAVVRCVLNHANHHPSAIHYAGQQPSQIVFRGLDCSKARTTLGWSPEVPIDEGIRRTVEWWKLNQGIWSR